jgi:hypothetical protein
MLDLSVVQGSAADWVLAAVNRDGTVPTGFLNTDTLVSAVWSGQDQTTIFNPTVSWFDSTTGQVNVGVIESQTAALEQVGDYHLNVTATRAGKSVVIIDCTLRVLPAPGSSTQAITPYCGYADLLRYANWISLVQDTSVDQEGFYSQRLEARQWLDWLIVRSWRGTSQAYFGDSGRTAQFWLGGWVRRTPVPSAWLIGQLAGQFISSITVTAGGSLYSSNPTITITGGGGSGATASANVSAGVIVSIFVSNQGQNYTSTPSVVITDGTGSGAMATAVVANGRLIVRPQTKRICALKAASVIGMGQIGRLHNIAQYGALFRDMASSEVSTYVAELDLNGDGLADLGIPIISTNTLFT